MGVKAGLLKLKRIEKLNFSCLYKRLAFLKHFGLFTKTKTNFVFFLYSSKVSVENSLDTTLRYNSNSFLNVKKYFFTFQ